MATIKIRCIHCNSDKVIKHGKTPQRKQRYRCCAIGCSRSFLDDYAYPGCEPNNKALIIKMAMNGSGIRDTARVLKVNTHTVIVTLKKACELLHINWTLLRKHQAPMDDVLLLPLATELDEQWSYVQSKRNQRWLWLAINHRTSELLAYTFGKRTTESFNKLKYLLRPFNIQNYFTDGLSAYENGLPPDRHEASKRLSY